MEKVEKHSFYKKIVLSIMHKFKKGSLNLTLPNGEKINIGEGKGLTVDLHIKSDTFFKKIVMSGDIGFGESYCDGDWETSDLCLLIQWAIQNAETSGVISGSKTKEIGLNLFERLNKLKHYLKRNDKDGSKKNISYHYDLSNDFYGLMLDESMSYSCGIFDGPECSLHQAQVNKLKQICKDLDIKKGDHLLEIGCGWGGFAIYCVTHFDCKLTGVTISKEQYNFAQSKIKKLGLEDKITILLKDYRELNGTFDKVVSIEMIEAVGHQYLPEYFQSIDRLLKKDGVAVIQAITCPDSRYSLFRKGVDFIQKHIFPGSLLPSIGAMVESCKKTSLHIYNLRDIGPHYAKTLKLWNQKLSEKKEPIKELGMDDIFFRKWHYYLSYCEAAFSERNISNIQVTFIKPNNTTYKL